MKQMSWASANTFALRALWLAGSMAGSLMLAGPARANGGDAHDGVISPGLGTLGTILEGLWRWFF